jgi:hypothetical protein
VHRLWTAHVVHRAGTMSRFDVMLIVNLRMADLGLS